MGSSYNHRVRVIAWSRLRDFGEDYADVREALRAWYAIAEEADWTSPADVKRDFASASFVANNRVIFNIKGNHYRLVVKFHYDRGFAYIRFVGTHEEYDKIDVETI